MLVWKCPDNVLELVEEIKNKNHPHLTDAKIAVAFNDSKPFVKNKFNWGTVSKFSNFNKLWQGSKVDFCIVLCSDIWHSVLDNAQREAWVDLNLCRCEVEYEPETVIEGKKKKVVKDDLGRIKYTNEIKLDDNGNPKWRVDPLDLAVVCKNASKYGLWCSPLLELKTVIPSEE